MSPTDTTAPNSAVHFDPFSDDFFNGPFETYRRLRNEAPVYHQEQYGFWALSRYEDVAPAMKDHETYSSAKGVSLDHFTNPEQLENLPDLIIMMDPPDHTRMRKLVNKVFTPRAIAAMEPMIRTTIRQFAERLDQHNFDAVAEFSALFPVEVISEMLGVPPGDRQQLRLWLDKTLERKPGEFRTSAEGMQAAIESGIYYLDLVQKRRAHPQDDMISQLTQVEVERQGDESAGLTDIEIVGFLSLLGGAGAETVTKAIGNAVVNFAANPDQWKMLREDRSKIPAAFEEVLRYEGPSQYNIRYSMRDVTLHGTTIPHHSPVMLINGSATRDERQFRDPDRFDITRKPSGHNLGFGYGVHSCLGAALARMEGRVALDIMADKMAEFDVDASSLRRVNMTNVMGYSHVPVHVIT
ncbi:cytochrome P450 [Mycobacterium sp. 94-17]|uniref:cytochrome P450 n=1 Tax=Mycobacterium sp. 94-17 TaxID=2986147 RepID=UPI002D1F7B9C|nr:cytochrome P450 [Mycobacterium sp. 94-17]MEB4208029.1 cytochrome P450 [Mycobacterium sp. 94-17]